MCRKDRRTRLHRRSTLTNSYVVTHKSRKAYCDTTIKNSTNKATEIANGYKRWLMTVLEFAGNEAPLTT